MWAEARKQEKRLRGLMVDHKRRAERRRDFYEKTKLDPNQFLQIHGQSARLHFDQSSTMMSGTSNGVMMPWQGQKDNLIDRFDGRAHLDFIPEVVGSPSKEEDNHKEMRLTNYERYRILIQNDFLKIPEEKFLQTISYEEKYGSTIAAKAKEDKKKNEKYKSAIGYVYEDSEPVVPVQNNNEADKYSDDSDLDLDLTVDVNALDNEARCSLNKFGKNYNLSKDEFVRMLLQDIEDARVANVEKQREEDKALFSQKKSRRERRLLKSKSLIYPRPSTPSYSATKEKVRKIDSGDSSSGRSRSNSPVNAGKIEFITSFGNDSEDECESTNLAKQSNFSNKKHVRSQIFNRGMIGPKLPQKSSSRNRRDHYRSNSSSRKVSSSSSRHDRRRRRVSRSESSSSSSEDNKNGPRYRSKYRARRNSSSSPELLKVEKNVEKPMSPPIKRYYKPTLAKESSDELELSDAQMDNEKPNTPSNNGANKGKSDTVKAKIQRKLQAQLKKQFKADKKAEYERKQRQREEQNCRDEELKEVFSKYKKKDRFSRHRDYSESSDDSERYYNSRRRSRDDDRRYRSRSSSRRRSRGRRDRYESDDDDAKRPKLVDY
ncbi:CLK4-associating serine/arginine rich protein isoform X1 [Lepeophtheirus salmonis]|uniref:Splicing factor, arginine/serinerich 16 [Nasonia vitripennis] n=2 Tax=Lepeophtheirus salmonis TaxID=72036 RepID=A0A0K2V210_LEPSM|nr:CLK4-associating serine/arginine rich protein-like isoform X2 [Lepeophtheirus salmonis]